MFRSRFGARTILLPQLVLIPGLFSPSVGAQLAITEVMASAANTRDGAPVTQNSDYWELTNFGADPVDLTGYKFSDDAGPSAARTEPFVGLVLRPGQSAVFVRSDINDTEESFRAWWGEQVPADTPIRFYPSPGFSSNGDAVMLWDANDRLVDEVRYGPATRGRSFAYDPATGLFPHLSTNGLYGAWRAVTADDDGSPGIHAGPVPLRFALEPEDASVPAGNSVTLQAAGLGLPRPRYQWFKDGVALPGATTATLTLTNAQPADSGLYTVRLDNGLESLLSRVARLTVDPAPTPPALTQGPVSLEAYEGQNPKFTVAALGNPPPTYQWQRNGVNLAEEFPYLGVRTSTLTILGAQQADSGTYTVVVSNSAGSTNASADLVVTRKPRLVITEVQSSQNTNDLGSTQGHADWWELTNLDDFTVNLRGYRFDDDSGTLAQAFTVSEDVLLAPGESVIWVEDLTAEAFRQWWGAEQLPPGLKIITYSGSGLGLSSSGDALNLWNAAADDETDKVASAVFSTATRGVSFGYDPSSGLFGELSVPGVNGAFVAAELGDKGSPGTIASRPRFIRVRRMAAGCELTWQTVPGKAYTLLARERLEAGTWSALHTARADSDSLTFVDTAPGPQRYYRVRLEP